MNNEMPWKMLARYLAGELSEDEEQKMTAWIDEHPSREKKVEELRELWEQSRIPTYDLDPEESWQRLEADMDRLDRGAEQVRETFDPPSFKNRRIDNRTGRQFRRLVMTLAAAAVVFAAGLFTYSNYSAYSDSDGQTKELATRQISADYGERAIYTLSDGSRVVLHAGSSLEIPLSFNSGNRELTLEGEAYFEVEHDASSPFIVHSGDTYTRVLGTKFLVSDWSEMVTRGVEVVVSEGKVAFGREGLNAITDEIEKEVVLTRNQRGRINEQGKPVVTRDADLDWYLGWTTGKLTFDNRPLSEILPKLERWYDIEIQVADDQIAARKLTAEIDYTQSMMEVMKGMALALELEVDRNKRLVTLHLPEDNS